MTPNPKSSLVVLFVLLFTGIFFVNDLEARRLGGGGGGFSRAGVASGGGFSARATGQQPKRQLQRANTRQGGQNASASDRRDNQDERQERRDQNRDERRELASDRQDNRQDQLEDHHGDHDHDDDWDQHHDYDDWDDNDGELLAGALVGGMVVGMAAEDKAAADEAASTANAISRLPCTTSGIKVDGNYYYNCSSSWYQRIYSGSQVTFIKVAPPPGY